MATASSEVIDPFVQVGGLRGWRDWLEWLEPEWVAAVVGALAAVVVAWQSWETCKNAQAAGDAARAANEAVALARIEEGHTRTLIADAVRTRIDTSTPTLVVSVTKPTWPPTGSQGTQTNPEQLRAGTRFVMPRDAALPICVRQSVSVLNPTDRPVELRGSAWYDASFHSLLEEPCRIYPGREVWDYYLVQRSLGQWVEIAEGREKGDPGPEHRFELIYIDQADTGAVDTYEVITGGVPIERISGEVGGWRIAELSSGTDGDVMASVVQPRRRRYWLSRTRNQELE